MNSDAIQPINKTLLEIGFKPKERQRGSSFLLLVLHAGLFAAVAPSANADFTDAYAVTPPAPGSYLVPAPFLPQPQSFGSWFCMTPAFEVVDTSLAPASLNLRINGQLSYGYFYTHAVASGNVSFQYAISGSQITGGGTFGWFNSGTHLPNGPDVSIGNLVPNPTPASFAVQAGDIFGFYVSISDPVFAERSVTIQNFAAPVPEPGTITLIASGLALVMWRAWPRKRSIR